MNTFAQHKLLVIGGTSGVGFETAKLVLEQGGSAVIVGNRPEKAENARQELAQIAGNEKITALTADLLDMASVNALIEKLTAEHGIRVNALPIGIIETRIFERFANAEQVDSALENFKKYHALGRNGSPRDVAETAAFLLSDKASWVTDAIWNVDGGAMTRRDDV